MSKINHDDEFAVEEIPQNKSLWVLSYCDLLCQLICFFILLFSMATLKNEQWQEVRTSLSQRLDPNRDSKRNVPAADISIEKETVHLAADLGYMQGVLMEKIKASSLQDKVVLQSLDDRLVISISGSDSFLRGSTQMTPQLESILTLVSDMLISTPNRVEIHGNADSNPVSGKKFASNWELSLTRAVDVGNFLRERGYPYRLTIFGRGDSAYKDLPENLSPLDTERLSRRIDIIIRADRADLRL